MQTVINVAYDIDMIDAWCVENEVKADWKPVWFDGQIIAWEAQTSDNDHFLCRLRFARADDLRLPIVSV